MSVRRAVRRKRYLWLIRLAVDGTESEGLTLLKTVREEKLLYALRGRRCARRRYYGNFWLLEDFGDLQSSNACCKSEISWPGFFAPWHVTKCRLSTCQRHSRTSSISSMHLPHSLLRLHCSHGLPARLKTVRYVRGIGHL